MPAIKLSNITKRWGKFFGVDNVSLDIPDNSFITLLGPSGCGKTTILRMIAGLETPTEGKIEIGGRVVFDSSKGINIPANKRKVGFLFQNYALWPNMTVYQNISFGLKNVKEELPLIDATALQISDEIRVLKFAGEVADEINACKDKTGKIDSTKACLKLIDDFSISMFTAKKILALNLQVEPKASIKGNAEINALEAELKKITEGWKAKGMDLNDKCEVTQNGQVVRKVRRLTAEEIDLKVRQCSKVVKIGMFMDRYPAELSGGQQQRVAIARTLAPSPEVLFMDEPLSNLDAKLRLEMRYELQRLHVETGATFVYVTHDQMEAMTLATKICLMNNGVLQQYDAPLTVYKEPVNLFAADFVGNPSINFIEAKASQEGDGSVKVKIFDKMEAKFVPNEKLDLAAWFAKRDSEAQAKNQAETERLKVKGAVEKANKDEVFKPRIQKVEEVDYSVLDDGEVTNEDLILAVRPEHLTIEDGGKFPATIYGTMPTGMESTLKFNVNGYLLTGVEFGSAAWKIGTEVNLNIKGAGVLLFDKKSGLKIAEGKIE